MELASAGPRRTEERLKSFVNGMPTRDGGTHEQGLKDAIVKAVRNFIDTHDAQIPKGVTLTAEDMREGMVGILGLRRRAPVSEPDQERLNNPEVARPGRRGPFGPASRTGCNTTPTASPRRSWRAPSSRGPGARGVSARPAAQVTRKGPVSHKLNLPGKLADCASTDPARVRAVHRRGRLGRWLGQAGPRPHDPGHPAAARQGAERRAGQRAEGALQQGAAGHRVARSAAAWARTSTRASCATARSSC
jgi:DNA gyrase/topoisomerase IV subunit B